MTPLIVSLFLRGHPIYVSIQGDWVGRMIAYDSGRGICIMEDHYGESYGIRNHELTYHTVREHERQVLDNPDL